MNDLIRTAKYSDIQEIIKIEKLSFENPWVKASFENELLNKYSNFIIITIENIIIGYAVFWVISDIIELQKIAISTEFQQQGYAQKLLKFIDNFAISNNIYKILLEVRESNNAAISLYIKDNYKKIGIRKKYYKNNENAILMEKDLTQINQ